MNLIKIGIALLLSSYFVCAAVATSPTGGTTDPPAVSEVFGPVVIAAGKSASFDSTLDYSYSSSVAVTVQCIVCTSTATSLSTDNLVLQAFWTVPTAQLYVTVENKSALTFAYWDAGGAIFNAYGTQFRLTLQNNGSQTIAIQQITLFRRSH